MLPWWCLEFEWITLCTLYIYIYIYIYTLSKIINATILFLPPFFMSWTQRSNTFSMYTKGLFLSNIVHKSVEICVSEHLSFAEIIHPPHRCGISRCWLDSMIIAQVCLRLATIKGHFSLLHNNTTSNTIASRPRTIKTCKRQLSITWVSFSPRVLITCKSAKC